MGGLVLEGTEAKILSDVVAQFYAYLSGCMFNDPGGTLYLFQRKKDRARVIAMYGEVKPHMPIVVLYPQIPQLHVVEYTF